MSAIPDHIVTASNPPALAPERVAAEVERLRAATVEAAFALVEQDWRGAARSAYRAAWHFHRLPAAEQTAYVVSDLHDDDGPMPSTDDWSAAAFVAWLVYRCNRTAEGSRRTPRPEYDATGRKLAASPEPERAQESTVAQHETDAPATPDLTQAAMFAAAPDGHGFIGEL
jgi:hypothetical protein